MNGWASCGTECRQPWWKGMIRSRVNWTPIRNATALPDRPTAVFCANDLSALGAMGLVREQGLHVPADLSIVGFDDIDEAAQASPPLTTVRQSPREVGAVIADTLVERLHGRSTPVGIQLSGQLIVRASSGPPRRP